MNANTPTTTRASRMLVGLLAALGLLAVFGGCYATRPLPEYGHAVEVGGKQWVDDVTGRQPAPY